MRCPQACLPLGKEHGVQGVGTLRAGRWSPCGGGRGLLTRLTSSRSSRSRRPLPSEQLPPWAACCSVSLDLRQTVSVPMSEDRSLSTWK